jgi:hypothetical protein
MQQSFSFRCPTFRRGTHIHWQEDSAIIQYQSFGCEAMVSGDAMQRELIEYLMTGHKKPSLSKFIERSNNKEIIHRFIQDLDQQGLLTETVFNESQGSISGSQWYREMRRYIDSISDQLGSCDFSLSLQQGQTKRNQLIGYLCEYFHIVYRFAEMVSPAISNCINENIRSIFLKYFTSELNHSRFIETALESVGITKAELLQSEPLPWTFALSTILGANARQHFISLICMLHIFEQSTETFYQLFKNRAIALGLKDTFYGPILRHADVNNQYQHDHIAKDLFDNIAVVNAEDIIIAKKNIRVLLESFHAQSASIIKYYANPTITLPRIFKGN